MPSRVSVVYAAHKFAVALDAGHSESLNTIYWHTHPEYPSELPSKVLIADSVPLGYDLNPTVSCLYIKSYYTLSHTHSPHTATKRPTSLANNKYLL